jgi:S-adenosylmethionine hydrolase
VGPQIDDWVKLPSLVPQSVGADELLGRIIHIDHFGNCITNFTVVDVPDPDASDLQLKDTTVKTFRRFFAEESDDGESVFAYWGSAGFLELAVRNGSAAKALNAHVGDRVSATIKK